MSEMTDALNQQSQADSAEASTTDPQVPATQAWVIARLAQEFSDLANRAQGLDPAQLAAAAEAPGLAVEGPGTTSA